MPSTERLPSGRYRGLYRDADGDRQRVPGTFDRKQDAFDAAVDAQAKAKRTAQAKDGTLPPSTLWGDWWEELSKERAKLPSDTPSKEASIASKWLIPQWAETPLNRITRKAVKKWVATELKERPGMSPAYAHKIFSVFRISMNAAVDEEILDASPCVKIELPAMKKKAKTYVSVEDAAAMRPHFAAETSFYADMIEFGLEVGMRPSELAGLHAHRIDRKRRKVLVTDVYVTRRKVIRGYPKDGDVRHVPLSTAALRIIDRRLADRDPDTGCGVEHLDGTECKHPLVFVNTLGRPVNANMLGAQMRAAAEDAEIGSKSGYAIRRGFATRTIEGGADPFAVQRVMGHADLEELAGYVQETPEADSRMLAALGERQPPKVVGRRGTGRGTDRRNQTLRTVTKPDDANAV